MMHGSWDIKCKGQSFVILGHFLPFDPLNNPKNQKFWKNWKKRPRAIIMLHLCIINDNHIMYGSWDKKCNRQFFFHFGLLFTFYFLLFYSPKNENIKKMKKKDIIILHKCIKNHDHMLHCSWDMVHDGCNCYF